MARRYITACELKKLFNNCDDSNGLVVQYDTSVLVDTLMRFVRKIEEARTVFGEDWLRNIDDICPLLELKITSVSIEAIAYSTNKNACYGGDVIFTLETSDKSRKYLEEKIEKLYREIEEEKAKHPIFKVGDIIKHKDYDVLHEILEISDGRYRGNGWSLAIGYEEGYELVEKEETENV